ncbi:MAG: class I SAM-dependent methyltransferase [Pseudomarimonas sp.]
MTNQFDTYAATYQEDLRKSTAIGGEEPDYFARYKVDHLAGALAASKVVVNDALDFGCGIGGSLSHLGTRFPKARIHGVDVSEQSLLLAAQVAPDASLSVLRGATLDCADQSFDVAMAACVFHHIEPEQRLSWSRELRRSLRQGSSLFIFEHNPRNPLTRRVVDQCPFDHDAVLLDAKECRTLMLDAGFTEVSIEYIVFFPHFLAKLRPLERWLRWLPLGAQYVARGRA